MPYFPPSNIKKGLGELITMGRMNRRVKNKNLEFLGLNISFYFFLVLSF